MSARSSVWVFLAVTFAVTWACQTPGILAMRAGVQPGGLALGLMVMGVAGPSLVALALHIVERRWSAGVTVPRGRRALPRWRLALLALLFTPVAHLIGSAVLYLLGMYRAEHLVYLPLQPEQVAIALIAPLGEELGWRGYALPRLQSIVSPLQASLWIGVAWALWHIPTLFIPAARGTSALELGMYLLSYLAGSVVYTWLYNVGGGSVLGPILAHLGIHLDNIFRASALGDGTGPVTSTALVMTLMATALVALGQLRPETTPSSRIQT